MSDDLFLCQFSKESVVRSEFKIYFTLVTMAMAAILIFFNPARAVTHYGGYSYKIAWSLMKGIQQFLISPFFCFHGNCGKVCPTDSDCFGLSRSSRCGCCSYQVSSISVWRVTCYDHFCVFHFFNILVVSIATAAIWKTSKAQLHMAYDNPTKFHYGISEKCVGQTFDGRKKERKKE